MQLIEEIEISYFRSFYKFKLRHLKDLNIIFGKNDSGKSNVVRALNLFFSGSPDHNQPFEFPIDFDADGIKAYQLDRNFVECEINGHTVKRGMHGRSYAACLPAPDFRQECKDYENMPIEFLFRDEQLAEEVEGKKLTLKRKKTSTMIGTKKIEQELPDSTHFKDVGAGKSDFADVIVPTFDPQAFDAFEKVFEMITGMIAHNRQAG